METINNFRMVFDGYGHYNITYISKSDKKYTTTTSDARLIDDTFGSEKPTQKNLVKLKKICKGKC